MDQPWQALIIQLIIIEARYSRPFVVEASITHTVPSTVMLQQRAVKRWWNHVQQRCTVLTTAVSNKIWIPCRTAGWPSLLDRTASVAASSAIASAIKEDEQPVVIYVAPVPIMFVTPYSPHVSTVTDGLSMTTHAADDAPCFFRKPPSEKIMIFFHV